MVRDPTRAEALAESTDYYSESLSRKQSLRRRAQHDTELISAVNRQKTRPARPRLRGTELVAVPAQFAAGR